MNLPAEGCRSDLSFVVCNAGEDCFSLFFFFLLHVSILIVPLENKGRNCYIDVSQTRWWHFPQPYQGLSAGLGFQLCDLVVAPLPGCRTSPLPINPAPTAPIHPPLLSVLPLLVAAAGRNWLQREWGQWQHFLAL